METASSSSTTGTVVWTKSDYDDDSPFCERSSICGTNNDSKSQSEQTTTIGLVVVESHNHALEHIHSELRRRLLERYRRRHRSCRNWNNNIDGKMFCPSKDEEIDNDGWIMIHFDSHPDMACPNPSIPARACFSPSQKSFSYNDSNNDDGGDETNYTNSNNNDNKGKIMNLYEMLDMSQSGIAEWILPLCLAGGLRHIHWIRSSWADQFHYHHKYPNDDDDDPPESISIDTHNQRNQSLRISNSNSTSFGKDDDVWNTTTFHVGAWTPPTGKNSCTVHDQKDNELSSFLDLPKNSIVKVDLSHPYYHDDGSVVPFNELLLPKPVQLSISQLHHHLQIQTNTDYYETQPNRQQQYEENVSTVTEKMETLQTIKINRNNNRASISNDTPIIRCDDHSTTRNTTSPLWALDICLDYYACDNPFLVDLESAVDKPFTLALVNLAKNTRFRTYEFYKKDTTTTNTTTCDKESMPTKPIMISKSHHDHKTIATNGHASMQNDKTRKIEESQYLADSNVFQSVMKQFFKSIQQNVHSLIQSMMDGNSEENLLPASKTLLFRWMDSTKLIPLFTTSTLGKQLLDDLIQSLLNFLHSLLLPKHKQDQYNHRDRTINYLKQRIIQLSNESIEALPNIFIPQQPQHKADDRFMVHNEDKKMKTIIYDEYTSRMKYALQKIKETGQVLSNGIWKTNNDYNNNEKNILRLSHPPMIITIARSSEFTSPKLVEDIQKALLLEIHSIYAGVKYRNCKIKMVFDYGETEGSILQDPI